MLRKKGLAAAGKKARCMAASLPPTDAPQTAISHIWLEASLQASRMAAQGLIGFARQGDSAAVLVEARICWPLASRTARRLPRFALQAVHSVHRRSEIVLQVNSETDFVARNDQFSSLVSQIAQAALRQTPSDASARPCCPSCLPWLDVHSSTAGVVQSLVRGLLLHFRLHPWLRQCVRRTADGLLDIDALRAARVSDDGGAQTVDEAIADVAGSVRENIQLRRAYRHALALSHTSLWHHAEVLGIQFAGHCCSAMAPDPDIGPLLRCA